MPLNDYEFKLNDNGVILNGDGSIPFVDIKKVVGLDSAPYRETVRDHEGTDGGFFDAEFEKGREVILEGSIFTDSSSVEPYLDSLKENFEPVLSPVPFYFKSTGVDERVIFVKSRGVRFDWEMARRIGITYAQFLMYAEDPRIYDNEILSVAIPFGGPATTGFEFYNVLDTFTRTFSPLWDDAESGETWFKLDSGDSETNYAVNGTQGTITSPTTNTVRGMLIEKTGVLTQHVITQELLTVTPTGNPINMGVVLRFSGTTDYYWIDLQVNTDDTITIRLVKNVGGVLTQVTTAATGQTRSSTIPQIIECVISREPDGATFRSRIRAKTWQVGSAYPAAWQIDTTDTSLTSGDWAGVNARAATGNTNTNPVVAYESYQQILGFAFPLDFGDVVPPSGGTVTTGGNRPTPATLTITGPVVNPRIINSTDSKTLDFEIELVADDTLVIDLRTRRVTLNDTQNRRNALVTPEWFMFNPGVDTFIVFGGGSGTGTLLIEYRNAWR